MSNTTMVNVRLDKNLKARAQQVLEQNNIGTTEFVKKCFEAVVMDQRIPDFVSQDTPSTPQRRRAAMRSLVAGANKLRDADVDPRERYVEKMDRIDREYREYLAAMQ